MLQLATQQLRLLFGLGAALLGVAQLAVGFVHVQARLTHLVIDAHAFFQQLFELEAQLFQRRLALLQVQGQLFALLAQALGLQLQALQGLAGRIVLGL
ncbi:hypothetical protein D3C80_975930 [compost metagenome]